MGSTKNTWVYDGLGNIIKRETTVNGTPTAQVTYNYGADSDCGWENLLTNITINNYTDNTTTVETIDYDEIGNPISYRGANLSWYGRQLKSFTKDGTTSTMTYDADGLRSTKTVGTRKTEYQYVGDKLFYEKRGDNQTFYYFYDSYGNLSMIRYTLVGSDNSVSTATYLVQTNSQGDVVALYTKAGALYARYEYDAWGNTLSVTDANGNEITAWYNIANANPIRYRGYYYDADLGLYYLQSRYYDSEIGRFINADGFVTTGQGVMSYNMYSYCQNNPVMYSDPSGCVGSSALDWLYENTIERMKNSDSKFVKGLGTLLDWKKSIDEKTEPFNDLIERSQTVMDKEKLIKNKYVDDIIKKGNGDYLNETPDPYVFPDIEQYNQQCLDMHSKLFDETEINYMNGFDREYKVNTMVCWDTRTTVRIGLVIAGYELQVIVEETINLMGG